MSILLCVIMVAGMLPTTAFASSDEEHECWYCSAIYYGDVPDDIFMDCCNICAPETYNDCWFESHCWECGGCYQEKNFWCEDCTMCYDCIADRPETHCADCYKCFLSEEDELCPDCHRCDSCVYLCPYCGYCEDCWEDADDTMHCSICGDCYEVVGFLEHDAAQHCPYCCETCEQCGDWETCTADNPEIEYCDECGECWCEHDACELCGLCEDCCAANSDCSNGMCVEEGGYDDHFCESCGACSCEFGEDNFCETCGYCYDCCLDARLIYGCDCDADKNVCIEDIDFDEHLRTVHGVTEPGEHDLTPETKWSMNDEIHWKQCRFCDKEDHFTEGGAHDFDSYGKCTVCGFQQGRSVYFTRQPKDAKATVSDEFDVVVEADGSYTYGETHEENNTVTFRVSARGEGELDYQWYRYDPEYPEDGFPIEDINGLKFEGEYTSCLTVHVPSTACDDERLAFAIPAEQPEKDNPLRTAEMTIEDDYGMIDGVINNGRRGEELEKAKETAEKKSSIRERLEDAKRECAEHKSPEVKKPGRDAPEHGSL